MGIIIVPPIRASRSARSEMCLLILFMIVIPSLLHHVHRKQAAPFDQVPEATGNRIFVAKFENCVAECENEAVSPLPVGAVNRFGAKP